jgi:hypothetical protein
MFYIHTGVLTIRTTLCMLCYKKKKLWKDEMTK